MAGWYAFDKYYTKTDDTSVYAMAMILHPSRRKQYIVNNWKKSWHNGAFDGVKKLWQNEYKSLHTPDHTPCSGPTVEPDEYNILSRELDVVGKMDLVDEYESYMSQSPIQINCLPLDWWLCDERCQ